MQVPENTYYNVRFKQEGNRVGLENEPVDNKKFRVYGKFLSIILNLFGKTTKVPALDDNGVPTVWTANKRSFNHWLNTNKVNAGLQASNLPTNRLVEAVRDHYENLSTTLRLKAAFGPEIEERIEKIKKTELSLLNPSEKFDELLHLQENFKRQAIEQGFKEDVFLLFWNENYARTFVPEKLDPSLFTE